MKHTEKELQLLKDEINEMWKIVISQLEKSKQSLLNGDIELAREIISREKRVDAFELKIESDCENYIALYSPVAIDLRLVLSLMKISITLERIADFAEGIARHVIDNDCNKIDSQIMEELQIENMFDILLSMISDCFAALEAENTHITGKILTREEKIDTLYRDSLHILTNYMIKNENLGEEDNTSEKTFSILNSPFSTQKVYCGLKLLLIIRKLERIGDHCSNIMEEIVFYVDAKVLKHNKN
ncbi:MAG: phosphate signaling complex protein PhoU [Bacteroidales bacterium]|jgi:phosphate transport system protein|nr:phosphate signaling complex protein PhoU [Bacteroidales bacterium]